MLTYFCLIVPLVYRKPHNLFFSPQILPCIFKHEETNCTVHLWQKDWAQAAKPHIFYSVLMHRWKRGLWLCSIPWKQHYRFPPSLGSHLPGTDSQQLMPAGCITGSFHSMPTCQILLDKCIQKANQQPTLQVPHGEREAAAVHSCLCWSPHIRGILWQDPSFKLLVQENCFSTYFRTWPYNPKSHRAVLDFVHG